MDEMSDGIEAARLAAWNPVKSRTSLFVRFAGATIAFIVGLFGAAQGFSAGALSQRMGGGFNGAILAASLNTVVGFVLVSVVVLLTPSTRRELVQLRTGWRTIPKSSWFWYAGSLGTFVAATQAAATPVVGVAVFTVSQVAGQVVSGLLADRLGLGPGSRKAVTLVRALAVALVIVGMLFVVGGRSDSVQQLSIPLVLIAAVSGAAVTVQASGNGVLTVFTRAPLAVSFLNFIYGIVIFAVLVGAVIALGYRIPSPPTELWLYLGGPVGVLYVVVGAVVVRFTGVLLLALSLIAGQIVGSVLVDALTTGASTTVGAACGAALALVGVAMGLWPSRKEKLVNA